MHGFKRTISAGALALLDLLKATGGRYTLSGQHNYISTGSRYTDLVESRIGRRPLIWGSDFSFKVLAMEPGDYFHCGPLNVSDPGELSPTMLDTTVDRMRDALIATVLEQHQRGHIITLMWHSCLPQKGDEGCYGDLWSYTKLPDAQAWHELVTPGTALHACWIRQIDGIAARLKTLRDAGVPVLWRPYHEMNGVWFWWCNRRGPDGFAALWRMMFERFTVHHQLDNLIWVWNTNAPRDTPGDEAFAYADFYPGGDCVDVLAADVYSNDYRQSHHDDLLQLADGRPIALGEVGQLPTPAVLAAQPHWGWFMPWGCLVFQNSGTFSGNKPKNVRALYDDPRVLACDDARRDSDGSWRVR